MNSIKIVIADDQSIVRDGLKLILELEDDLEVVRVVSNGNEAYEAVLELKPDVVLMDIRMPICDGVLGTKKIIQALPETNIIILTTFSDDTYIFEALKSGAKGYLLKDVESSQLADSIRIVANGGMLIHPKAAARIVNELSKTKVAANLEYTSDIHEELTSREIEIVKLVAAGKSNREISMELFISEGTVKNHITKILSKLALRDRTQIAIYASQHKFI